MTTRIMVIDDEPLICTLLEYQLGGAGYAVNSYQRGEEALLRLAHEQPDLILLDVMMPEISGWDLCRQIRVSSAVPVIMLTAKHGDDDVVAGLTSGADDYVGKPFNQAQLVARIEAVLRRSSSRTPRAATPLRSQLVAPAPARRQLAAPIPSLAPPPLPQPDMSSPGPVQRSAPPAPTPPPLPRLGSRLAAARRERGLSLHDAGHTLGIRWEFLQAIEQEEFSFVPRLELRQALKGYSALLGVDLAPYTGRRKRRARRPSSLSLTAAMALGLVLIILLLATAL